MTGRFDRELSIWADFNALDEDHRLRTSLRFAAEWPAEGEWIVLHDDEGNTVKGFVESIDGLALRVHAEMSTWQTSDLSLEANSIARMSYPTGEYAH